LTQLVFGFADFPVYRLSIGNISDELPGFASGTPYDLDSRRDLFCHARPCLPLDQRYRGTLLGESYCNNSATTRSLSSQHTLFVLQSHGCHSLTCSALLCCFAISVLQSHCDKSKYRY